MDSKKVTCHDCGAELSQVAAEYDSGKRHYCLDCEDRWARESLRRQEANALSEARRLIAQYRDTEARAVCFEQALLWEGLDPDSRLPTFVVFSESNPYARLLNAPYLGVGRL